MSKIGFRSLWLLFVLASLPVAAAAQEIQVSWYPSVSSGVAGYNVYVGRSVSGSLVARPIDVGRPQRNAQGIASVVVDGVDLTAPQLAMEMTAYDASGRESARSNRVLVSGDGETIGAPLWSSDFNARTLGSSPPGFFDYGGSFTIGEFHSGGPAVASPARPTGRLSATSFLGSGSRDWGSYELEGRLATLVGGTVTGVAVRVVSGDLRSAFLLGAGPDGTFVLDGVGKPAMTCAGSDSTDVPFARYQWYRFRLRYTDPSGRARLRAKVWNATELEPSLWQVECWTNAPAADESGVFALFHTGSGITYWDDLVVRPVTGTLTQPSFQ